MKFKYYTQNNKILTRYNIERDLAKKTIDHYEVTLNQYSEYQDKTLEDLLEEAYLEEDNHIPMRHRKIRERLENYRIHLIERGLLPSSINEHFSRIRTFYKHNLVDLPPYKKMTVEHKESINDLPTKKDIKNFLSATSNLRLRAIVLFMYSSGSSTNETVHISIQDFIDATSDYHNEVRIENVIYALKNRDDIVPTFNMYRHKTHTPYFTFCTPEATSAIILYLESRLLEEGGISHDSMLFNLQGASIKMAFKRITNKLGMPKYENGFSKFRPHALRKAFASELYNADLDSMTIDFLSGRTIPLTQQAYFKADPIKLKKKYMLFMNNLTVFDEVVYHDINSTERDELKYYREKMAQQEAQMAKIERLIAQYENI